MKSKVWLVGAGVMAQDYFKVLKALGEEPLVIGRSQKSVEDFKLATQHTAMGGGLEAFLETGPGVPSFAIVSVSRETLSDVTCRLLSYGIKNILVEKPAGLSMQEIDNIVQVKKDAKVLIGFNRHFYASVQKAKELILEDGGVQSFSFEFTEWSHKLKDLVSVKGEKVMRTWFLGNSIHVADLAFYLGGLPQKISTYVKGGLDWHPNSSVFAGAGISNRGALFSYQANWESAGRWGVEFMTAHRRIILRPLEELHIQKKGAISIEKVELDHSVDFQCKPGLYQQVKSFLDGEMSEFSDIEDLKNIFPVYLEMAGYGDLL